MITYNELKTCPIGIYKLNKLFDYVVKWNYILDNPEDFIVEKWIKENNENSELLEWLKSNNLDTNKKFLYGLVNILKGE